MRRAGSLAPAAGQHRSNSEAHHEAADVRGITDPRERSKRQVVGNKCAQAPQHSAVDLYVRRSLLQINVGN